ncbi:MAG: hypothetical protein PUC85_04085 [bacterium]|nr:hypothetical protein [bacterium]
MARAASLDQVLRTRFKVLPFEGEWKDAIGCPELTGSWIVWGNSGNGKTRFALQLCKYLCQFGRVAYDSLEEGVSVSLVKAIKETHMMEVRRKFVVLDKEPIDQLTERLEKPKSPDIVCVDSLQYTGMSYEQYKALKERFPKKLFIWISHADGTLPEGRVAKKVRFDSNVKVFVQAYRAEPVSRYGGGKPYIIWEEGYRKNFEL